MPMEAGAPASVVLVANAAPPPTILASDGQWIYWSTTRGAGAPLARAPVSGGPTETIAGSPTVPAYFLAVDDSSVVYQDGFTGNVYRLAKDGTGTPVRVGDAPVATPTVDGAALLDATLYQVTGTGGAPNGQAPTVQSTALAGGAVQTLASLGNGLRGALRLGVTSTSVVVSDDDNLLFFRVLQGVAGGIGPVPNLGACRPMASEEGAVYCTTGVGGGLFRVQSDGTTQLLVSGASAPDNGLVVDDTYVYWVGQSLVGAGVHRVGKTGGAPTTLADTNAIAIAVDAQAVYWTDGGSIMRLAK